MTLTGSTPTSSTADLWFPSTSDTPPNVSGSGIESSVTERVPGGWRAYVRVNGDYRISLA